MVTAQKIKVDLSDLCPPALQFEKPGSMCPEMGYSKTKQ